MNIAKIDFTKRVSNYAIARRNVTTDYQISTLFGLGIKMKKCTCCDMFMPITNFYLKDSDGDAVRSQCCKCWDQYNGKNPHKAAEKERVELMNTLEEWF
jgi:hypothetical protein